jgi:hypothetical protein
MTNIILKIRIPKETNASGNTPLAPKVSSPEEDDVECAAGCGSMCNPDQYVGGFCSRSCFNDIMREFYDIPLSSF